MDWYEKIYHLKKLEEENAKNGYGGEYFIDISYVIPKWQPNELETLIKPYPWLPEEYINFVKEFDNLGLAFCVFYGSVGSKGILLSDEIKYFKSIIGKNYFPFGKDADPSIFTLDKSGAVWRFDRVDWYKTKEKYADSFQGFVEDCLMGKRYHEFTTIKGDTYYDLLKSLDWT
jgi:hypothetical protein